MFRKQSEHVEDTTKKLKTSTYYSKRWWNLFGYFKRKDYKIFVLSNSRTTQGKGQRLLSTVIHWHLLLCQLAKNVYTCYISHVFLQEYRLLPLSLVFLSILSDFSTSKCLHLCNYVEYTVKQHTFLSYV